MSGFPARVRFARLAAVVSMALLGALVTPLAPRRVCTAAPAADAPEGVDPIRFATLDVFVNSRETPLAAYQFELRTTQGNATVLSLEGGEHAAFNAAPYYDPRALSRNRLIVAAFSTSPDLPHGRMRVARLHIAVRGGVEPRYAADLQVAAAADGTPLTADVSVAPETPAADRPPASNP